MPDNDELEVFEDESEYKFKRIGSFGRFSTSSSFPIDFMMTTFDANELDELTLARDVRPDKLDFELLMQRDIDEERVGKQIEPYLIPEKNQQVNMKQIVFFPPILAAVIPVKSNEMQPYYTSDKTIKDGNRYIRTVEGLFKLTFVSSSGPNAYPLKLQEPELDDLIYINKTTAQINIRQAKGAGLGVKLVVIDGQHRLRALQLLSQKKPELISDLVLPVCLLIPINSNERFAKESTEGEIPTVHEVFRKLFVDVNKTAQTVGGHFTILLSDSDVGNLMCRSFCSALDTKRLAVVEWNTKNSKDSTIIKRDYSITSIGVIDQALDECLNLKKELPKYLLNLKNEDFNSPDELQDITWTNFSVEQKKILAQKISDNVTPLLVDIFFNVEEFNKAYLIFSEQIDNFQTKADKNAADSLDYSAAIGLITEYLPTNNNDALKLVQTFNNNVKALREENVSPFIGYAVFQRAIIEAWVRLLAYGKKFSLSPKIVTEAFILILNSALKNKGEYFSPKRSYMLHSVFSITGRIIPSKVTKNALASAIFAQLGNDELAEEIASLFQLKESQKELFLDSIQKDAISSADKFLKHYEKNRRSTFIKTYTVDFEMTAEEKAELSEAEDLYKRHLNEVKEKKRERKNITVEYNKLIMKYVEEDLHRAYNDMREALNYDEEILNYSSPYEEEVEED